MNNIQTFIFKQGGHTQANEAALDALVSANGSVEVEDDPFKCGPVYLEFTLQMKQQ
jgi:hypothetical protein